MSMNYGGVRKPLIGGGASRVRPEFKDECDLNKLLKRHASVNTLPLSAKVPTWGADVSMGMDFKEALDHVAEMKGKLRDLPKAAQELYKQNPRGFMEAIGKLESLEQAEALGLIEKKVEPTEAPGSPSKPPEATEAPPK